MSQVSKLAMASCSSQTLFNLYNITLSHQYFITAFQVFIWEKQCSFLFNNFSIEWYSSLVYALKHEISYMESEKGPYSRSSVSIKNMWLENKKASTQQQIFRRLLYLPPILSLHRGFQDGRGGEKRLLWVGIRVHDIISF